MRTMLLACLTLGLVVAASQPAQAQEELKAVIVKAVKAHGGEEKLAAMENKGVEAKSKGTIHLLGGFSYTGETFAQLPNKFKEVLKMEINGMQVTQTVVLDGDKCWINVNGMNIDLGEALNKEIKEQMHERRAMSLLPLLKGKEFELAPLGEVKVGGQDAVGVKASAKDRRDVSLYFAKDSGLLVKIESRPLDFMTMQEVAQEIILSDYKEMDGYKAPQRLLMNRNGEKFLEREVTEFRIVDKIDDSVFAKP